MLPLTTTYRTAALKMVLCTLLNPRTYSVVKQARRENISAFFVFFQGQLWPFEAVTEIVPDLILAPVFFGPQEIWSPRNMGPKKVGPRMKTITQLFHAAAPKLLGAQMRSGTISVIEHILANQTK